MRFSTLDEWLVWQEALHPKTIDLGLARVRRVFQGMGTPLPMPFTIAVGGTNGKGSSVAMLDAILRAQGYRVGAYTSPHLLRYNERMRIDGQVLDDESICRSFDRIDRARGDTSLSFFEFGTLAALDIFAQSELDVQILEVGLGGRLDAVNIVDADAVLIASIDLDHQEWLGDTREAIALEKAGIFRPGRPAVVGDSDPPKTLLAYAAETGIRLDLSGRDFGFEKTESGWNWWGAGGTLAGLPLPALCGEHQLFNAAAVLQVLGSIRGKRPVGENAVHEGLSSVKLQGRFQLIDGTPPVLLDVAHNPQSARVLADHLKARFPGRRVHAVFAVMRDKDIEGVVTPMAPLVDRWYLAPLKMPRAATSSELVDVFGHCSIDAVSEGYADAASAFAAARRNAHNDDVVVVFGSFFLVSEFLALEP
ncbi:bifunctional tetrahydrofolate synthase/dihydrofolate synthase [Methylococcus sp. EFPC2]|uniref:bifunctional tetrahydrofolate synthase/dihydrofolate synthase n=1 Tax=Methylococcus sp. EFPC2 TaxID=2812648 RepID=UPI001966F802|nr:bifunctional tetrahydrofolate synthase/dihydrofolate synthase [Methylococcus sp. EFPC2]QSA97095.1 bifunctional tetrahydrofolate synthase/dihydrofolate synthase [Methylococcus sp. EFPC2]